MIVQAVGGVNKSPRNRLTIIGCTFTSLMGWTLIKPSELTFQPDYGPPFLLYKAPHRRPK